MYTVYGTIIKEVATICGGSVLVTAESELTFAENTFKISAYVINTI
jgi:hypothetical protein